MNTIVHYIGRDVHKAGVSSGVRSTRRKQALNALVFSISFSTGATPGQK